MGSLDMSMESAKKAAYAKRQEGCCRSCLRTLVKGFNAVVLIVGLALLGYGAYLAIVSKQVDILSGAVLTVGLVDTLFPLLTIWCGARWRCWLQCSMFFMGFVTLGELVAGCFFVIPGGRKKVHAIVSEDSSAAGRTIDHNLLAAGLALFAAAAMQVVALLFMYCQSNALIEDMDLAEDDAEQRMEDAKDPLLATEEGKAMSRSERRAANASNRYKEKNAHFYEKYKIGGSK